jgi:hypothetical protein
LEAFGAIERSASAEVEWNIPSGHPQRATLIVEQERLSRNIAEEDEKERKWCNLLLQPLVADSLLTGILLLNEK